MSIAFRWSRTITVSFAWSMSFCSGVKKSTLPCEADERELKSKRKSNEITEKSLLTNVFRNQRWETWCNDVEFTWQVHAESEKCAINAIDYGDGLIARVNASNENQLETWRPEDVKRKSAECNLTINFHISQQIHNNQDKKILLRCFEWQLEVVLSAAEKRTNILQECHEAEKEIRQVGENAKNQRKSEWNSTDSSANCTMRFDLICCGWTLYFYASIDLILENFMCTFFLPSSTKLPLR